MISHCISRTLPGQINTEKFLIRKIHSIPCNPPINGSNDSSTGRYVNNCCCKTNRVVHEIHITKPSFVQHTLMFNVKTSRLPGFPPVIRPCEKRLEYRVHTNSNTNCIRYHLPIEIRTHHPCLYYRPVLSGIIRKEYCTT